MCIMRIIIFFTFFFIANRMAFSQTYKPLTDSPEGVRAFRELGAYYEDSKCIPKYEEALKDICSSEATRQKSAGLYLFALLKQSFADEQNGRGSWKNTPYWGGGSICDAQEIRKIIAREFAEKARGEISLPAALWLIDEETLSENQKYGMEALRRIESAQSLQIFQKILAKPHPNGQVLCGILREAGKRKMEDVAQEILKLCGHHRTSVREAARAVSSDVGIAIIPEFKPENAFTPCLDEQLRKIANMVMSEIPANAVWKHFASTAEKSDQRSEFSGWLVKEEAKTYRVVNYFGQELDVDKEKFQASPRHLADDARWFRELRVKDEQSEEPFFPSSREVLSQGSGFSAQFEPQSISLPEALVSAWCYVQGDKSTAASLFFPCIDKMEDDRWVSWIVRDVLGHIYHRTMLDVFAYKLDYPAAMAYARHLSKPVFDGYQYQKRAQKLAEQLAARGEDFKTFTLPFPEEWEKLKTKMTRTEQIIYLAQRLRLLRCIQRGQPGDVNIEDKQYNPDYYRSKNKDKKLYVPVIHPYLELRKMQLKIADLPTLVPFLADENFLPTFGFWRNFHPARILYQANWLIQGIINDTAKHGLVDFNEYSSLDEAKKKEYQAKIFRWCQDHLKTSPAELTLEILATVKSWEGFKRQATEALETGNVKALPLFIQRMADFPSSRGNIVEFCYYMDSVEALPQARQWINDKEEDVRFWAALILLKYGDKEKLEGLLPLTLILDQDDGTHRFPLAIPALLATKKESALHLASSVIQKEQFRFCARCYGDTESKVLHWLFLAGSQECFEYLTNNLESQETAGMIFEGAIQKKTSKGDETAVLIAKWRSDNYSYPSLASDDVRKKHREELKTWLKEQFDLIRAGKTPNMKTESEPLSPVRGRIDAPGY